jgi:hypothetical protein
MNKDARTFQERLDVEQLRRFRVSYVCTHPECGKEMIFDLDKPFPGRHACPFCNEALPTDPATEHQLTLLTSAMVAYKKFCDLAARVPITLVRDIRKGLTPEAEGK